MAGRLLAENLLTNRKMTKKEEFENLWIEKYRPSTLDDIVLSDDVKAKIKEFGEKKEVPHLLFYGEPGGGKTSLVRIIVNELLDCEYLYINGSEKSGVDVIRGEIKGFAERKSLDGSIKIVIIDECDGLSTNGGSNTSAQKALRNMMEEFSGTVRFILTANYINMITDPIISRCMVYSVVPPLKEFGKRILRILALEHITYDKKGMGNYIRGFYPDMRRAINTIQRDVVNGKLTFKAMRNNDGFFENLVSLLKNGNLIKIREEIAKKILLFSNDYHVMMKGLFEHVYTLKIEKQIKSKILLVLSEAMYRHSSVIDKEINCFSALIRISDLAKGQK